MNIGTMHIIGQLSRKFGWRDLDVAHRRAGYNSIQSKRSKSTWSGALFRYTWDER
jgi:hypothetical protein